MGIRLRCKDYGHECEFVIESDDAQEVMLEFGKHSDEEHGISVSYTHLTLPTTPYV